MNMKKFFKVALGTGLFMLDQSDRARRARRSVRERVGDHIEGLRDLTQDTYQATAERVASAANALRKNNDDNRAVWNVVRFALGLGVGIGVGFLVAPANGEETRAKVAEKAQEITGNVRQHFASSNLRATATDG